VTPSVPAHPASRPCHRRRHRHRGGVYLLVLLASSIVAVVGTSALIVARIQNQGAQARGDADDARLAAQAAVELGRYWIQSDASWRLTRPNGRWVTGQPVGNGATFSLDVVDPNDGLLLGSDMDPVVLTGTGARGAARWKTQVTLVGAVRPYPCLYADLTAAGNVTLNSVTLANADNVCSNAGVTAGGCTFSGTTFQAISALNFTSCTGTWSPTFVTAPRQLPPDPNAVFNAYLTAATPILYTLIPQQSGTAILDSQVVTPFSAPFGILPNLQGVYSIDCGGKAIIIRNCRINGTLILLNAGGATVDQSNNWEAYVSNFPALMVKGNLALQTSNAPLLENGASGSKVNFNPLGSPYHGVEDIDTSDSYPSLIQGLIYVSGNLTTTNRPTLVGCVVVGGTVTSDTALDLTYNDVYAKNPPPGFAAPPAMVVQPGSWLRPAN
jgi:hypothetical protein